VVQKNVVKIPENKIICRNYAQANWVAPSGTLLGEVRSPYNSRVIGEVHDSTAADVDLVCQAAQKAFPAWRDTPIKERCRLLLNYRDLVLKRLDELSELAAAEAGKTVDEARAGIMKGIEVCEFGISLQNIASGGMMTVSRGVTCETQMVPLGVVAGIVPFNFPAMVPMWMYPIALTLGNCFVMKPSEKVPLTMSRMAELLTEAGYPAGVFSIVHGGRKAVEAVIDHPAVKAVAFVGSTPVAKAVYQRATQHGKRALCLGGAKNQLILAPDANPLVAIDGVVKSFTGCAGQRCMAASLMLAVGQVDQLITGIIEAARKMRLPEDMGAIIDRAALDRIHHHIDLAVKQGAKLILDGRQPKMPGELSSGNWIGPTIIDHATMSMDCAKTEIFGPVLTIVRVSNLAEAMKIENASTYGNATSVFTTSGAVADYVCQNSTSGMLGVNIGVPVPREPFSFGGTKESRFGACDITGESVLEFWADRRKITRKWELQRDSNWMN
jgi:malonate-semialdehyde dehydrogenase (acetylating)/methylmalonate-semialdehyde dehydrogenase